MPIFQLTTSQGGRRQSYFGGNEDGAFNSRPHKEVDEVEKKRKNMRKTFNSRPHKEVDGGRFQAILLLGLSTHDLTRRSTGRVRSSSLCTKSFNSRPHKEVDASIYNCILSDIAFNSRPHKEVDAAQQAAAAVQNAFQLTTSQGGRPLNFDTVSACLFFQLTTSQGGRHKGLSQHLPGL